MYSVRHAQESAPLPFPLQHSFCCIPKPARSSGGSLKEVPPCAKAASAACEREVLKDRRVYGMRPPFFAGFSELLTAPGSVNTIGMDGVGAKIEPDKAEEDDCGGSTVYDDNDVWLDFRGNPKGRGRFFPVSLSLVAGRQQVCVLLVPGIRENRLPSPPFQ